MRSFGLYTNLVEIGRGGMAAIYRATAPDGNLVALKLLPIHLAADKTARTRFEQESNLGLNHPNIVRVIKSGVEADTPYIEMEYVPGESLDRLIARIGPLAPQDLAPILIDVGRALDYAHERGVVHRDVKPSNIILRPDGRALLADFGVAKAMGMTAYTATATRVGSVFFMSPEQASGSFEITKASDVYSLGVTAYHALTRKLPFEASNEIAVARQHIEQKPRHVSDVRPSVPRPVGDVVMQAMEKAPTRRPASAGAFARGFATALTHPSIASAPASAPLPPVPPPLPGTQPQPAPTPLPSEALEKHRRPSPWIFVGVAALVILAGLLAVVLLGLPGSGNSSTATPTRPFSMTGAQPGLVVISRQSAPVTSVQQVTPDQVLVPLTPIASTPTARSAPAVLITPAPPPQPQQPAATRIAPPTRGPINPLPTLPPAPVVPTPFPSPATAVLTAVPTASPTVAPTSSNTPVPTPEAPTATSAPPTALPTALPTATIPPIPSDTPSPPPAVPTLAALPTATIPPVPSDTPLPPPAAPTPAITAIIAP